MVREPGYRTKMIVRSTDSKVDPVGACIGVRGIRIKNIIRELGGEKLDVIPYIANAEEQLAQAFHPVVIRKFEVSEDGQSVFVVVDDEDFPTTIGKKGMNVRLLGSLMGVQLKVQKMRDYIKLRAIERQALALSDDARLNEPLQSVEGMPTMIVDLLTAEGFETLGELLKATPEEIAKKIDISVGVVDKIFEQLLDPIRKDQGM